MGDGFPDSKVHGANMGPISGRQGPGGPHVGPKNFAIWVNMLNMIRTLLMVWSSLPRHNSPAKCSHVYIDLVSPIKCKYTSELNQNMC